MLTKIIWVSENFNSLTCFGTYQLKVSDKTVLSAYEPAHPSLLGAVEGEQITASCKSGIKSISYSFKRVGGAKYITI